MVTSSIAHERRQIDALGSLGMHSDIPIVRQSERFELYDSAIDQLRQQERVYECFCTRREVREASQAPHPPSQVGPPVASYPGTCRTLSDARRAELRGAGRLPALRFDACGMAVSIEDLGLGPLTLAIDDVVLRRSDGVPAYNLAVVVDDAAQGVTEVVRGDDLFSSTPRQVALQRALGLPTPRYRHVPLAINGAGQRLAKRDGAVTLAELVATGLDATAVLELLAVSLGLATIGERPTLETLLDRFDPQRLPREPWIVRAGVPRSSA